MTHVFRHATLGFVAACLALAPLQGLTQTKKIQLAIVSAMDAELADAFYAEVAKYNGWVDGDARPETNRDADALVYFLNSWADAPGAEGLSDDPDLLAQIQSLPDDQARHEITVTFEDGQDLPVIFYSLEASGFQALTCYAQDIAKVLRDGSTALTDGACEQ